MSALAQTTWESTLERRRRIQRRERPWKPKPYAPNLRRDQLKALFYLKELERRPMTKLLQEALDHYLERHGGVEALIERGSADVGERGERVCRRCGDR
jgi:hypothetical protein